MLLPHVHSGPCCVKFMFKVLPRNQFCSKSSWWPLSRSKVRGFWPTRVMLISRDPGWYQLVAECSAPYWKSQVPIQGFPERRRLFDMWQASGRSRRRCQQFSSGVYFSERFAWSSGPVSPATMNAGGTQSEVKVPLEGWQAFTLLSWEIHDQKPTWPNGVT